MSKDPLEPNFWNIRQLFENRMYEIPVYQRPYSWDTDNVDILLKDISDSFNERETIKSYYTGNLIVRESDKKVNGSNILYDVIDGQQRITTFTLILLTLHSLFSTVCSNPNDPLIFDVKRLLWQHSATRYPEKELPSLRLNSIEKKAFEELFDYAFDNPQKLYTFACEYNCKSDYEKRVIENFKLIFETIRDTYSNDENTLLDYASYIIEHINFINIECNEGVNKVFSIFESINSKGKPLEEIDKIKCYIFSELDEASYKTCLNQWGELIVQTKDELYDYLMIYIRAYIKYYRQNISLLNFKNIAEYEMEKHFNTKNLCETFKALLEDMLKKVKFYNMLSEMDKATDLINNHKFRFYFRMFVGINYKHPKALFYRAFIEFANKTISEDNLIDIFVTVTNFMVESLTLSSRDSKDVITMFSNIFEYIYSNGINADTIIYYVAKESEKSNLSKELLKYSLVNYDAYSHKNIAVPLLALYEAYDDTTGKISFDQADVLASKFSESFALDHLLVQTPKENDDEYKYCCQKDGENSSLLLKDGHDFPEKIQNGMPYEDFQTQILNKFGNVRIFYRDKNSSRQNNAIALKDYGKFTSYADIIKREEMLVEFIVDKILTVPPVIHSDEPKKAKKNPTRLPRIDELVDSSIVSVGDKLYITTDPENSEATLLSSNKVEYKGKAMSLNRWGQLVTGWPTIAIYNYACIVGETETLDEKRRLLNNDR